MLSAKESIVKYVFEPAVKHVSAFAMPFRIKLRSTERGNKRCCSKTETKCSRSSEREIIT